MSDQQHINSVSQPKKKVLAKDFAAKMRSKAEVYKFLGQDCKCFLPPQDTTTVWHLRDLVSGKRRRIYGKDVKDLFVP